MSKEYQHVCIKPDCTNTYKDNDVDAYYCESCNRKRVELAKKIDASTPKSRRQEPSFEEKMKGFHTQKGITLINVPRRNG